MKSLQSLTHQFQEWRRNHPPQQHLLSVKVSGVTPRRQQRHRKQPSALMWAIAVVSLTSVAGNRFYNQPKLDVGTVAPATIKAPSDANVEDVKTTEEKRKAARRGLVPALKFDLAINQQIDENVNKLLAEGDIVRSHLGDFPFTKTEILSWDSQRYLRQAAEWEWRLVLLSADGNNELQEVAPASFSVAEPTRERLHPDFFQAVAQLRAYRSKESPAAFAALVDLISQSRQNYSRTLAKLNESGSPYDSSLLELTDREWQETQTAIQQLSRRILAQGIPPGLPNSILQQVIVMHGTNLIPAPAESVATKVLLNALQPNLVRDEERTKRQADEAAQAVTPELIRIRQGEAIVSEGEKITQSNFVLLDHFGLSYRRINWLGFVAFGGIVAGGVGIFYVVEYRFAQRSTAFFPGLRRRDHLLVCLLSLSTPLLSTFGIYYINLPAVGWLIGNFYGATLGITVVGLLTGLVTIGIGAGWEYLLTTAVGGILAATMAARMRSREELALLGGAVGLAQGIIYLSTSLMLSAAAGSVWYTVFQEAAQWGLHGLGWSIAALGISPYLERFFDVITPIRLAELANPNRPLLKRLAAETPGTFQHTLFVANLAEAAARELNCNVELVRAGTLYHDIGKMHDPLGFIENQMGGPNKHDEINDPWKSVEIIKKHVSEGLVMARKHGLPKAIQAFIPEHQGTMAIAYFYHQAKQLAEQDPTLIIREEDFSYPGPAPQSRETGIVMLADSCEAALRSLKDATAETALIMINKILRARWQDNQLIDSGLTREELSKIAEVFVKVWQQSNHQRIAYPK